MSKIRVSQNQLNIALREGHRKGLLVAGAWAFNDLNNWDSNITLGKDRKDCKTCAVGNIYAEMLEPTTPIRDLCVHIASAVEDDGEENWGACSPEDKQVDRAVVTKLLKARSYLTALSHVFEGTMESTENNTDKALTACLKLIKRFPKTITLDIDGFTLKKKKKKVLNGRKTKSSAAR